MHNISTDRLSVGHDELKSMIQRAATLLPIQGPISSFVFLNPLQGLEHLPFDQAVQQGAELFGCETYLSENRYAIKRRDGRIGVEELEGVIREELGSLADLPLEPCGTIRDLRLRMLEHPLHSGDGPELDWYIAESEALLRLRSDVPAHERDRFRKQTRDWLLAKFAKSLQWPSASNQSRVTPA
ncbi:MAG: putative inorganic carbon transporter subunit DabA, partial [Planctomycetaceae bacterium]